MSEKSLKEHLAAARKKRWDNTSVEKRKEHSKLMNKKRWPKKD